jgi:hypothetical protein
MIRILVCASVLFLAASGAYASHGEFELFDRAYEYYLAYQPERAVETFRTFLREFPESSAKDVAIFWLGKSLIQTRSVEEAKQVFSELKHQFPESPIIPYVDREMENLGNPANYPKFDMKKNEKVTEAVKPEDVRERELKEAEMKIHLLEEQLTRSVEEKDRLGMLIEEEKKKTGDIRATMTELEKRETESRILIARMEEEQKKNVDEMEKERTRLREEKEKFDTEQRSIQREKPRTEAEGKNPEDAPKHQRLLVIIKDNKYTTEQVLDFMVNASSAMAKGGIKEILWRNGSLFEDFINEQILYDEAKKQNVAVDAKIQGELTEKFRLTAEEAEYLKRYLTISDLIDRKIGNMPEERVVESLTVRYTARDRQEKAILANELQAQAKAGRSFEEIYHMFPDKMQFSTVAFQELQGWIKERIELLQDGEVSAVWTKDGYMILKPVVRKASYRPFEEMRPGRKDEIRAFVREWTDELRKEIKEIRITKAE